MCGIAGLIGIGGRAALQTMTTRLAHRGPDDEGAWNEADVWLGHRRLSVVDLSQAGRQPMVSASDRYVIVFNGEIYNHGLLRRELDCAGQTPWRGRSDTEVLLEAIDRFGLAAALRRAIGMFALALWDRHTHTLCLARDRLGEKPLYYACAGGGFAFASELSSLAMAPGLPLRISPAALSIYFRRGYIPAPFTIYEDLRKLPPGSILTWRAGAAPSVVPYWTIDEDIRAGRDDPIACPFEAVQELDRLLRHTVSQQSLADVPVGAFLSGGVDSSTVVAIMQALSRRPVRTFTIGFESQEFDEAVHAREVAAHLGADHTEHYVTMADAAAIAPQLADLYDEPFADASQIPTVLISRLARRDVTVCLSGDGGDEVFGGYSRYSGVPMLWEAVRRLPGRKAVATVLARTPMAVLDRALRFLEPVARRYGARGPLGPSLRKAARWLCADDEQALYELSMTAWRNPGELLIDPPAAAVDWRPPAPAHAGGLEAMMWQDTVDYLPGDILCKVDRAAMACGLETRMPLLDPRIAAFAWRLPATMKLNDGVGKWVLRQLLHRHVPPRLVDRRKSGFCVPLHAWLTGGLRDWAEALLEPAVVRREAILRPKSVARVWRRYLAGDTSLEAQVWSVLMFRAWSQAR